MSIPTQMSLVGFIASAPDLHFTKEGAECCRLRVGVEQWRKEVDGSFTKLDPTFHDMVAFESTARETYARFRKGDSFVASGSPVGSPPLPLDPANGTTRGTRWEGRLHTRTCMRNPRIPHGYASRIISQAARSSHDGRLSEP